MHAATVSKCIKAPPTIHVYACVCMCLCFFHSIRRINHWSNYLHCPHRLQRSIMIMTLAQPGPDRGRQMTPRLGLAQTSLATKPDVPNMSSLPRMSLTKDATPIGHCCALASAAHSFSFEFSESRFPLLLRHIDRCCS